MLPSNCSAVVCAFGEATVENCDSPQAKDRLRKHEGEEAEMVPLTDARVDPEAVMVESCYTTSTLAAMSSTQRLHETTPLAIFARRSEPPAMRVASGVPSPRSTSCCAGRDIERAALRQIGVSSHIIRVRGNECDEWGWCERSRGVTE